MQLTFYTKPLCPLCERLEDTIEEPIDQLIAAGEATYTKCDINDNPTWYDQFWDRIPVLTCDDLPILEGNPSEDEITRAMRNLK
jgi:hypothetical protein